MAQDEQVVGDLRVVQARASAMDRLLGLELPALDQRMETRGGRAALPEALAEAIDNIGDVTMRTAARHLFPVPYGPAPWETGKARGTRAGGEFGVSYDAFRKRGEGRPVSRLELVIDAVATQFEALTVPPPADQPSRPSRARSWVLVGGGMLVVVMTIGGVMLLDRDTTSNSGVPAAGATSAKTHCDRRVGDLDIAVGAEPVAKSVARELTETFEQEGGSKLGCVAGPAYRWKSLIVQDLVRHGTPNGSLLISPNGVDLWMNRSQYTSYHQIGGRSGDIAQTVGGLPERIVTAEDGHVEIQLSAGTVLIAERRDAPYFWIAGAYVSWWRHHPELGIPVQNPLPSLRQDFLHGYAQIRPGVTEPEFHPISDARAQLPHHLVGRILRQPDGTAWVVRTRHSNLVREWIPDGETWNCNGGDAVAVHPDTDGSVVAALPYAGHAHCPDRQ
ncbi:MAG: hypothetical protein ABIP21_06830 [Acidimicrobiia bacterium]